MKKAFKRETKYRRLLEKDPSLSLIACVIYGTRGVDKNAVVSIARDYRQQFIEHLVLPTNLEKFLEVGITVVDKKTRKLIRSKGQGYYDRNIVVDFDEKSKYYSLSSPDRIANYKIVCKFCDYAFAAPRYFKAHKLKSKRCSSKYIGS